MSLFKRALDLLLPAPCSFCRAPVADSGIPRFCSQCWLELSPVQGPVCPCCGRPFGSQESLAHSPEHECLTCRTDPPHFDQALAAGLFEGPLREAIHVYKYRPVRSLGKHLAAWMAEQVRMTVHLDLTMPVPLHRKRLRQRGFNQALILAHGISERFSVPLLYDNLMRLRSTRPQVELSGPERRSNVKGAFGLVRPAEVRDKRILLIDDVFTTGATMNECAKVLKEAGAASVTVLTLARTVE
ncbi:MAG: ComF family protein [Nitrospirae bacterium]|nr:ComF family protein [Nitrospirota bacterium]